MSEIQRRSTGMKDRNGVEIFEGDHVVMCWGLWRGGAFYRKHVVTAYTKKNRTAWHLDTCFNEWSGKQAQVIPIADVAKYPDQNFYFQEDNTPTLLTFQMMMGWSDERYAEYKAEQSRSFMSILAEGLGL